MAKFNATIPSEVENAFPERANIDQNSTYTSDRAETYSWTSSQQNSILLLDEQQVTSLSNFQRPQAGFIGDAELQRFMFHSAAVALAVGLAAVACGVLNALVSSAQRSDAYTRYLLGTNIADTVSLFAFLQFLVVDRLAPPTSLLFRVSGWYVETVAGTIWHRAAVSLNALASLERFVALIFPFRASTEGIRDHPSAVVMATFSLTILGHLPLVLEYSIAPTAENEWTITATQLQINNSEIFLALKTAARVIFLYLPIIFSFAVNIALIIALRVHASNNRQLRKITPVVKDQSSLQDGRNNSENYPRTKYLVKTTRLVLCLTLAFFCCVLPRTINATVSGLVANYGFFTDNSNLFSVVVMLANIAAYLTQPSLLVVSTLLSRQFRTALSRLLGCEGGTQKRSADNLCSTTDKRNSRLAALGKRSSTVQMNLDEM